MSLLLHFWSTPIILKMIFINAIDLDKYADSFDSISVAVLAQNR